MWTPDFRTQSGLAHYLTNPPLWKDLPDSLYFHFTVELASSVESRVRHGAPHFPWVLLWNILWNILLTFSVAIFPCSELCFIVLALSVILTCLFYYRFFTYLRYQLLMVSSKFYHSYNGLVFCMSASVVCRSKDWVSLFLDNITDNIYEPEFRWDHWNIESYRLSDLTCHGQYKWTRVQRVYWNIECYWSSDLKCHGQYKQIRVQKRPLKHWKLLIIWSNMLWTI